MTPKDDDPTDSKIPRHLRALFERDESGDNKGTSWLDNLLPESQDDLKTGRMGRALQISKLAVGGSSRWLWNKAKNLVSSEDTVEQRERESSLALAKEMLQTFSQMRGIAMKMGQMLSYMDNFLPPEAQRVLTLLQRDAPPMSWSTIQDQVEDELGAQPESLFADFEQQPLAAASIGQVHRAVLRDGTRVAVKIQYPGIDQAMRADLKNAKILGLFQKMLFFRTDAKSIMQELETRFLDECDYTKEADYQERFFRRFQGHPHIVIPKVYREFTTQRIITTEFQDGLGFYEWLGTQPSEEMRHKVARSLYRFYLGSLYLDGWFHCDPHPGNYIFRHDGTMAFLDFGCCRHFPQDRKDLWIRMCKMVIHEQFDDLEELAIQVGFFASGSNYNKEAFVDLMRYLYRPYLKDEPFQWRDHPPDTTFRRMFLDNPNLFKLNMPYDAVFLNRIGFGLVSIQAEINSPLNCRRQVLEYFAGRDPDWPEDPQINESVTQD